jgi:hypothetical protein
MERRESQAEDARPADDWMVEAGARVHVDGDDMVSGRPQWLIFFNLLYTTISIGMSPSRCCTLNLTGTHTVLWWR